MKILFRIYLVLFLVTPAVAQESVIDIASSYKPELLPSELVNYLSYRVGLTDEASNSLSLKEVLANEDDKSESTVKRKRFWAGSKVDGETYINVILNWVNKDPTKPSMTTSLDFNDKFVLFKMSHPFSKAYLGGYRISWPGTSRSVIFLEGDKRRSFVVAVPKKETETAWAIALCPRHFDEKGNDYEVTEIKDNGYRISDATFSVTGTSSGRFTTVGVDAYARSSVLVSEGISSGYTFEDVARSADPDVSVIYRPKGENKSIQVGDKIKEGVVGGIKVETKLIAPAGQERIMTHESRIQINEVITKEKDTVVIGGINHPVEEGHCVLVTRFDQRVEIMNEPSTGIEYSH